MKKIIWTDHVRNEDVEVLHGDEEEINTLQTIKKEKLIGLVTSCLGTVF
jgi:hypothetical protein